MDHLTYNALVEATFLRLKELAELKGGEYSGDQDRLANFKRNALALGTYPEVIWAVYSAKHWDALMQYIKDLQLGVKRKRLESIEGRVDDLLVYLLLLKAMLVENSPDA